ncbi:MinD/ParA family ATP-binding protein [Solemya velesiana gill symbiont]|uniref:Uncharacterized protein n=1 Tax=Solemya velesiana gill symbiont TaxID=1918948 RepID=A0A1T2KN71_9GAMM|nr:hypothetical protein [Solemya velesiana gill symbiont]OOZ34317.1 hypothetical protein BOW51_12235 [Solemya velesiana gill symbiont]
MYLFSSTLFKTGGSAHDTFKRFKGAVVKYLGIEVFYLSFVFSDHRVAASVWAQKPFLLEYPDSHATCCLENASYLLTNALKKRNEKFFSEHFELLCDAQDGEQPVPAVPEESAAKIGLVEEQAPAIEGQFSDQAPDPLVEELLVTLREFCERNPDEISRLSQSVMRLMDPESQVDNAGKGTEIPPGKSEDKPRPTLFHPDCRECGNAKLQDMVSACQFAAQVGFLEG